MATSFIFEKKGVRLLTTFPRYPETVALNKRAEILAVKEVIATEKLHGSNMRVIFPAGMTTITEIRFGGRNELFNAGDRGFYGGRPVQWFLDRPDLLQRLTDAFRERGYGQVTVFGEVCGAGIQKGVRYVEGDEIVFRAFDIQIGDNLVTHNLFEEICELTELPRVPIVWRGEPSLAAFDALLEKPSLEGHRNGVSVDNNLMEGVVIRSNPLLRTVFGDWLIVKHKSAKFDEVAKASIRADRPDLSPIEEFAETYVPQGRIINALGRLREAGMALADDMEDMPRLASAVIADLHKECEPQWQALLAQGFAERQIRTTVTKTVGRVYRRMLLEAAGRSV